MQLHKKQTENKVIILSAPSGAGKTTIVRELLKRNTKLKFSVSATTRTKRNGETDGKDYYFLTEDIFKNKIDNNEFVEYEMVYKGLYYGTLKSEVERIWAGGNHAIFDVDVKGGINIKKQYKEKALLLFIMPPSIEELEKRLRKRKTENELEIEFRIKRAKEEITYADKFDKVIINDNLKTAIEETCKAVENFTKKPVS